MLAELMTVDLFLVVLMVGLILYWFRKSRRFNLPPGPIGLPIVGYMPFLHKDNHNDFIKLGKKYGDIFSLRLGSEFLVIINEIKLAREALEQPAIRDRPDHIFDFHPDRFGFLSSSGSEWIDQRRYTMRSMHNVGLAKTEWLQLLEDEVSDFIKIIEDNAGKPLNPLETLSGSVSSNITSLLFGNRFPMGDPRRKIVNQETETVAKAFSQAGFLIIFPKVAAFLAKLGLTVMSKQRQIMEDFVKLVRTEINARKIKMKELEKEIFIDDYLREIEKKKGDPNTMYTEKNLIGNVSAMANAGSESPRTSLIWLLLTMAKYQDLQRKVHAEIDGVLGKDGKCNWMERNKLPYTYATILEGQRWKTVVPLGLAHKVSKDTKVAGFDIPKGSGVIVNIWALHRDPKYWKEAEKFNPDRFLRDGTLLQKPESFAPFSVGRRACPGEFVALIEIFHYFTALMQKFHVDPIKGREVNMDGVTGTTYWPIPQELLFTLRD